MIPRPVMAGNWKMNLGPEEARRFVGDLLRELPPVRGRSVALFPPAISFAAVKEAVGGREGILLGVQNVHWEGKGAFTGETSAGMAKEAGADLVLVGHSERRHLFGETPEETARKVRAVLDAGLVPVLCVGETLEEREAGRAAAVVEAQLRAVYDDLPAARAATVLIAYEPVWAIGTGRTASPADAAEMHAGIRAFLRERLGVEGAGEVPILYGGSVKPENAAELLAAGEVDGVLVGGASLDAAGFARICQAPG